MSDQQPGAAPAPPEDLWSAVDDLWAWLDGHDPRDEGREAAVLPRVLKLSEEVGEVAQAVIGATGQNPRKGVTHTWDDVEAELCDVAITALVALRTLTPQAREVFARHLGRVRQRSLGSGPPEPETPEPGALGRDGDERSGPVELGQARLR